MVKTVLQFENRHKNPGAEGKARGADYEDSEHKLSFSLLNGIPK
jgi:hypothetical protein